MKIFMLIRHLNYAGAPTMFLWVAKEMNKRGHEVIVCTYKNENRTFQMPHGIKWIDISNENRSLLSEIKKIRGIIKTLNPDVSVSFFLDSNIYNILACLGIRTKAVVCERNDPYKPGYYKLKILKPFFRFADGAVFQLKQARKYYDNVKVPIAIIPNPIVTKTDIRCEPHIRRKHIVVTHGRLDIFQKRQDVLINAFSLLVKEYPDYQLHIYGSQNVGANDEQRLKRQIENLGLVGSVMLMGVSKNPKEDIKDAMVWVSTSDFEGISNALIDAMSIGMPCVATDCSPGGAAFLIKSKENGLLVKRGDPYAVYEGIKYMIEHPDEADEMGKKALDLEKKLDANVIGSQWEDYLLSLISNK